MSKKEIINKLIQEGKSFEEIVIQSGAKQSYVKSCFTKLGKDWEDADDPNAELRVEIVEVSEEDIPEDAVVLEEGLEIVEEPVEVEEPKEPVDCSELIKKTEEAYTKAYKSYKNIEARILKTVLEDLKSDRAGNNQGMVRRMLNMHVRSMLQKRMFANVVSITDEYFELIK